MNNNSLTRFAAFCAVSIACAAAECAPLIAEMRQVITELEAPQPPVIDAYAKFAGDNSAMERADKAREKAASLRRLLKEIE